MVLDYDYYTRNQRNQCKHKSVGGRDLAAETVYEILEDKCKYRESGSAAEGCEGDDPLHEEYDTENSKNSDKHTPVSYADHTCCRNDTLAAAESEEYREKMTDYAGKAGEIRDKSHYLRILTNGTDYPCGDKNGNNALEEVKHKGEDRRKTSYDTQNIGHAGIAAAVVADIILDKELCENNCKIDAAQQVRNYQRTDNRECKGSKIDITYIKEHF